MENFTCDFGKVFLVVSSSTDVEEDEEKTVETTDGNKSKVTVEQSRVVLEDKAAEEAVNKAVNMSVDNSILPSLFDPPEYDTSAAIPTLDVEDIPIPKYLLAVVYNLEPSTSSAPTPPPKYVPVTIANPEQLQEEEVFCKAFFKMSQEERVMIMSKYSEELRQAFLIREWSISDYDIRQKLHGDDEKTYEENKTTMKVAAIRAARAKATAQGLGIESPPCQVYTTQINSDPTTSLDHLVLRVLSVFKPTIQPEMTQDLAEMIKKSELRILREIYKPKPLPQMLIQNRQWTLDSRLDSIGLKTRTQRTRWVRQRLQLVCELQSTCIQNHM